MLFLLWFISLILWIPKYILVAQLLSCIWPFVTPWTAACQASLSFTISLSLFRHMWIKLMMPWNHFILCYPFSFCPQSFAASGSFPIRQPKYWCFNFSICPSNEYSGLISLRIDWFDLAVQGTLQESSPTPQFKSSILWCSAFFMVQLSHPWMTTEKP